MLSPLRLYALCSALLHCLVLAESTEDGQNMFIQPPAAGTIGNFTEDWVYTVGQYMTMQWYTNFSAASLLLYQDGNNTPTVIFEDKVPAPTTFLWTVDLSMFSLDDGNVFFFWIGNGTVNNPSGSFTSHYWDVQWTNASPGHDTMSNVTGTTPSPAVTTSVIPQSSTSTALPAPTASATSQHVSKGGLSTSAKIGVGVGLGVGAVCFGLGLALGLVWWVFRRRRTAPASQGHGDAAFVEHRDSPRILEKPADDRAEVEALPVYNYAKAGELPTGDRPAHELGA